MAIAQLNGFARIAFLAAAVGMLVSASPSDACTVPVFRYALERWSPDPYIVMIFHKGELDESLQQIVQKIEAVQMAEPNYANIVVETVDVDEEMDRFQKAAWERQQNAELPWMAVLYPHPSFIQANVWAGKPTADALEALVDSPARREIARRILKGQTAVWLLLESGDKTKDDAAAKLLKQQSQELAKMLKLPEIAPEDRVFLGEDTPDLRVEFSVVRVSRNDPKEKLFVQMLLHSESDLHEFDSEPMVFPVFGRGRALYALVGKGIEKDNIVEAASFLCGACSCQVKNENPGTDLLMAAGWRNFVHGEYVVDEELPPLIGLPEMPKPDKSGDAGSPVALTTPPATPTSAAGQQPPNAQRSSFPLWYGILGVVGVGLAIVVFGTFWLKAKAR